MVPKAMANPIDPNGIFEIDRINARVAPFDWTFPRERAAEIEAMWARDSAAKSGLFNGRVLIQHHCAVEGGTLVSRYVEAGYKPFYCWNRMGYPPPAMRNGFAMAALKSRDGAFLLGVMSDHTANAGKIYFAAGTPDKDDVLADGTVDLAGSVLRELGEETGLRPDEVTIGNGYTALIDTMRVALMRPVFVDLPADEARKVMLERIAGMEEKELADIHIVRGRADIVPERMPVFMRQYLEREFGALIF